MRLEIVNARETPLRDEDVRTIVGIEFHPEVRAWLTEYVGKNFEKEAEAYKRFFRKLPHNRRVEILLARYDMRVVGFLALWRLGKYMEHVATLGISVHPDYWGKGVAMKLVESAIELAKRKGLKRLKIETLSENMAMRRVAEKAGFKLEATRKDRIKKNGAFHDEVAYFLLL